MLSRLNCTQIAFKPFKLLNNHKQQRKKNEKGNFIFKRNHKYLKIHY